MEVDSPVLNLDLGNEDIVYGHRRAQTNKVKWLCLDNVYPKFHRSSIYDIGGTYIEDVADYWFTYKTEQVGNVFLLHIFAGNNHEGTYTIGLSYGNDIHHNKKNRASFLSKFLKYTTYNIKDLKCQAYITTYSFTELDIEFLKEHNLYIALKFVCELDELSGSYPSENMQHDFRALLENPICSDFIIESQEGFKFPVHKIILMSHSDVFQAMLKEDTAESLNNIVQLVDVATDDVRAMLEFIYTGTITNIENVNFTSVLMLADRYNLPGMRDLCRHALAQQITPDNAVDILMLADMHDSQGLKLFALKYIKSNKDALESTAFKEIKNAALLVELCKYLAS